MDQQAGASISEKWENLRCTYERTMSLAPHLLQFRVECTLGLAGLCDAVPEDVLSRTIPILAQCLSNEYDSLTPSRAIQVASVHCLTRIARSGRGRLASEIGHSGAIGHMVRLIYWAMFHSSDDGFFLRLILKCLAVLVSVGDECRRVLYEENGAQIIPCLSRFPREDTRPYLSVIMSAMSTLEEYRKGLIDEPGGLRCLVHAASTGSSMVSRERACQAIGLLGASSEERYLLVEFGAISVLVDLFRNGDSRAKLVAANALGVLSGHVDSIKEAARAGPIPLYAELLQGPDPIGKEIAEDVFSLLTIDEASAVSIAEHATRVLRDGDDEAKLSAADVLWNIAVYSHSVPVVRNSGAIPILVQLLRDGSFPVRTKVSGVIAVLSYNKCDRDALVDVWAIPTIQNSIYDDIDECYDTSDMYDNGTEALLHLCEDPDHADRVREAVDWSMEELLERFDTICEKDGMRRSLRQMRRLLADPDFV